MSDVIEQHGPVRMRMAGWEFVIELAYPEDNQGHIAVCGMFTTKDRTAADGFYRNACRIVDCWYVEKVFQSEGRATIGTP